MRILLTGGGGFVGSWAAEEFSSNGHEVLGTDVASDKPGIEPLDITQPDSIRATLESFQPEACLHLGGIAFVPMAWENPQLAFNVNTIGTINLLEGFRDLIPAARILVVSSAEVYGRDAAEHPLDEDAPLRPSNLYAVTKTAADESARLYARQYDMAVMTARPQNHIGPGQNPSFVVSSFARQVADIAAGIREPVIRTGNLESRRDFLDVRDVVKGYRLILEAGHPGSAYNLASGQQVRIGDILSTLCELAGCAPEQQVDPDLYRKADSTPTLNTDRIRRDTGWSPEISLRESLKSVLSTMTD